MGFDSHPDEDGLAVLKLRKWGPAEFKYNPSSFSEGFISPTRKFLLLLSYDFEALLLPLVKEQCTRSKDPDGTSDRTCFDLPEYGCASTSDATENLSRPCESRELSDDIECSSGANSSGSGGAFISDVHSVAWGLCAQRHDQHGEDSLQELLFLSGRHGVTVHVFSQLDNLSKVVNPAEECNSRKGMWVEWGPSTNLFPYSEVQKYTVDHQEISRERPSNLHTEGVEDDVSSGSTAKRWWQTFLSSSETLTSGNDVYTKFPAVPSLTNKNALSFRLFDQDSKLLDFLSHGVSPPLDAKNGCKLDLEPLINGSDTDPSSGSFTLEDDRMSNSTVGEMSSSYKCVKVFSCSSNCLVGFALSMINSVPDDNGLTNGGNYKKVVVAVGHLVNWGIHWLFTAKLHENPSNGPLFEWIDFSFSARFLISLSSCGLISLYGATTGVYVASLDVTNIGSPGYCLSSQEQENVRDEFNQIHLNSDHRAGSLSGKRRFKRLLVFSNSSLLGAMDECCVTYVTVATDHISGDQCLSRKIIPNHYDLDLELLTGWDVGASEIGYQRAFRETSVPLDIVPSSMQGRSNSAVDNSQRKKHLKSEKSNIKHWRDQDGPHITSTSGIGWMSSHNKFPVSDLQQSCRMRKVFLPSAGYNETDVICCSPLGITRLVKRYNHEKKWFQVVHAGLQIDYTANDETDHNMKSWEASTNEAVGCNFHGFLYLVTEDGLSVVIPSIAIPANFYPVEAIGYRLRNGTGSTKHTSHDPLGTSEIKRPWSPWKVEVLDRILVFEGLEIAEKLCSENGWDLRIPRIRHLQLALNYLKFDEVENSLEMLMGVDLAVEGILRLLLAALCLMVNKVINDSEVSAVSRLLSLATAFATRFIRKYGLLQHNREAARQRDVRDSESPPLELTYKQHNEEGISRNLREMAQLLVVTRNMQGLLNAKFKRPVALMENEGLPKLARTELFEDESKIRMVSAEAPLGVSNQREKTMPVSKAASTNAETLALVPADATGAEYLSDFQSSKTTVLVSEGSTFETRSSPMENPKDMMARWELDNLDLKTVVRDALISGRLPLAVLRLHLHRLSNLSSGTENHDTFNDVRVAGRAIAYDLFLKGEIELAITTLQKLGEDVETTLKQIVFGTVRRSLRVNIAEEMKQHAYLEPHELKRLEILSLIERVYPCNNFCSAFSTKRREHSGAINEDAPEEKNLQLLHLDNLIIVCGEVDGVVLGAWTSIDEQTVPSEVDDDSSHAAYWTAAVAWSDAWDQRDIDRILLDQPLLMGVNVLWESQLEYHVCHNDWVEASKLLEVIPSYALSSGSLLISLDDVHAASVYGQEIHGFNNYGNFLEEVDTVCMDVPSIRVFRLAANRTCSSWLRMLMEQQLAKKLIFLTEYWHGTADIVPLLAQSGFLIDMHGSSLLDGGIGDSSDAILDIGNVSIDQDAVQALHKVVIHFCAQYNLLNLLDLYVDLHKLAGDQSSVSLLQDAVGDNEWAKCLLLLRVKGREYDASFSNVRAVALGSLDSGNKLNIPQTDNIIQAVDDIAERAGEIAALATLMFAPLPLQECLSSGSVNRHCSSAQCTLENLRPALQRFPTLWNKLVAACFGQDPMCCNLAVKKKVPGYSDLLDSLHWREGVFFSSVRDTSILQMIPSWFPKSVRRLIQLYVQGPIGWHSMANSETEELSMLRDIYYVVSSSGHAQISATSWEAAVQKHIEEELYASSLEGAGAGLEHHLHRGRALAALNHVLSARVHKLKSENKTHGQSESSGQANIQSDVQILLAPITESEETLLSSVIPLAIEHFSDTVLVASCAFLLELCGLSASILRLNIAALRRISSFYQSADKKYYRQMSPKVSAFYPTAVEVDVTESLARALADGYLHEYSSNMTHKGDRPTSRALLLVLQHLERASLPLPSNVMTCGSWLSTGTGNGADLRSHQKASSEQWQLVTTFCQMHNISLSTKYLAALARDNDWVGFLSEAQLGKYPFETVIQVASQEFEDPRLKIHIITVLKSMQSRRQLSSSSNLDTADRSAENLLSEENAYIPAELFGIIAECEKHEKPGEALLLKAKNLCWSVLAMIASCFPDASAFSCLTVWLEITAARETSAIKVNDIASLIAKNVGAAVEATNSLPASSRTVSFHYNRKSSKRRRLTVPVPADSFASKSSEISADSTVSNIQGVKYEGEIKQIGDGDTKFSIESDSNDHSLSRMVSVLCEQRLFLPLLQAFEIFLPSCSLLPFIRALQAFSQMRLSEASDHLGSFATRIKEESSPIHHYSEREGKIGSSWIISTAVKAADAVLLTCPSPYEKRCLLRLLAVTDFGDEGSTATRFGRLCWKIDMAEPSLRSDDCPLLGNESLDDASLLTALEKNGYWEQARSWAKQLEASGESQWKSAANHVTEMQAEAMVTEWKEFLWDVPEERISLWTHCQTLFIRHSYPALQAGVFFLKHAEAAEKDIPAREIHEILLLALQWLSGMITLSNPFYPLHLLREIETRVWLLAVESETQVKGENEYSLTYPTREPGASKVSSLIDRTATVITKMDNHINARRIRNPEKNDKESSQGHLRNLQTFVSGLSSTAGASTKPKRRTKGMAPSRRSLFDEVDKKFEYESTAPSLKDDSPLSDENLRIDASLSKWEERVGPAELERAVLSLLDFGQTAAARQLQTKLSPDNVPSEFLLVDAALKLATLSTPRNKVSISRLDEDVHSVIQSYNLLADDLVIDPLEVLQSLASILVDGNGRGLCRKIVSVVKAANVLGLTFLEAFEKQPLELLQLLSLKAQESFEEANLLVQTHSMPASNIAQILAESFLKGLLAAHRGGYMDSQKEEGPAPLLWRFSDFLKWAELCPSDSEIGHALMRLVITGQEIPHACEVELLILSHHFYKLSTCLDGVDVLVALAATRVEAYVLEGDFSCLARLITGVGNFYALNFILSILIENGQLDLLVQKFSAAAQLNSVNAATVKGFRMVVLTSLKLFNPKDLDGFAMVYNQFDMRYETAALLELRAKQSSLQWFLRYDKDQNEDLLESMRYYIEAAKVYSELDAGNKVRKACAQASLVSLQIRMPDTKWLHLSETNARRILVEQFRFQEALIVAEAYDLNRPSEWALVLWEQMLNPELTQQFVEEFVSVLPIQPSMLSELARFYRSEMQARGDQSQFSVWLTGGGLPADWAKYLGKSFRCLLRRTRDLRLKLQLAASATGFADVIDACNRELDKVPENAGPLILRKGHGGAYLPLM